MVNKKKKLSSSTSNDFVYDFEAGREKGRTRRDELRWGNKRGGEDVEEESRAGNVLERNSRDFLEEEEQVKMITGIFGWRVRKMSVFC